MPHRLLVLLGGACGGTRVRSVAHRDGIAGIQLRVEHRQRTCPGLVERSATSAVDRDRRKLRIVSLAIDVDLDRRAQRVVVIAVITVIDRRSVDGARRVRVRTDTTGVTVAVVAVVALVSLVAVIGRPGVQRGRPPMVVLVITIVLAIVLAIVLVVIEAGERRRTRRVAHAARDRVCVADREGDRVAGGGGPGGVRGVDAGGEGDQSGQYQEDQPGQLPTRPVA